MNHWVFRLAHLGLILCALVALSACSSVTGAATNSGSSPHKQGAHLPPNVPYVRVFSQTQTFPRNQHGPLDDLIEPCPADEVVIGGGFQFPDIYSEVEVPGQGGGQPGQGAPSPGPPTYRYSAVGQITESYPTDGGWRITFAHPGPIKVTVFVECLVGATAPVTVHETDYDVPAGQVESPWELSACPSGSMVIGGGFSVRYGVRMLGSIPYFSPDGSGWSGTFANATNSDFIAGAAVDAICYGVKRPVQILPNYNGQVVIGPSWGTASFADSCPSGWTLTAGAYTSSDHGADGEEFINAPSAQGVTWDLGYWGAVFSGGLVEFVECVQFSGSSTSGQPVFPLPAAFIPTHVPLKA